MSHRCSISSKSRQHGHRVSHAKNRRKHVFLGNIQTKRIWLPDEQRMIKVKLSTKMMKTIDKIGLSEALKKHNMTLADLRKA